MDLVLGRGTERYFSQSDTPALVGEHLVEGVGQQPQVSLACLFQRGTSVDELGNG